MYFSKLAALCVLLVTAHCSPAPQPLIGANGVALDQRSVGGSERMDSGLVFRRDDGSYYIKRGGKSSSACPRLES